MSQPILNAKITLNSVTAVGSGNISWDIVFSIIDYEGVFSGLDVALNDVVLLDTSGDVLGTITQYKIIKHCSTKFFIGIL